MTGTPDVESDSFKRAHVVPRLVLISAAAREEKDKMFRFLPRKFGRAESQEEEASR